VTQVSLATKRVVPADRQADKAAAV
jgi:hypothetical protein